MKNKRRRLESQLKAQSGSQRVKGINYVPKPPLVVKNISLGKEMKPEKMVSLVESSFIMMVHLKIKSTCIFILF
jgi:hypothetical protein